MRDKVLDTQQSEAPNQVCPIEKDMYTSLSLYIDCSCMWVQVMLPVKGFLVLLIEAVASGQLAYILFSQV